MKRVAITILRTLAHIALSPIEAIMMRKYSLETPPIFIIGPPRSGTSLLYEMMITRFHFSYMSNAAHRLYKTPITASKLFQNIIRNWRGDFTSHYGHIDGWGAPNEGGWIWQRWLEDKSWTDGKHFPSNDVKSMQQMVAGFEAINNAPFLNKNVMHSNRLQLINKIWPNALFIEVKRNYSNNARSIIRAQVKENINVKWWSVKPKIAADYYGKDIISRAAAQTIGVADDIAFDKNIIGEHRFWQIQYDELCNAPEKSLLEIAKFLASHDVYLKDKDSIICQFKPSPIRPLSDDDEKKLMACIEALSSENRKET